MKSLFFLITLLSLVSCAVSRQQMEQNIAGYNLPHKPEKGEGVIYVVRPSGVGALVRFNVYLDVHTNDNEMGWNRGSQFIYIFAKSGEHKLFSLAENNEEMTVNVKEGQPTFIRQDAYMGLIMARNGLTVVDEVEGKYWVKNLSEGKIIKTRLNNVPESRLPASK